MVNFLTLFCIPFFLCVDSAFWKYFKPIAVFYESRDTCQFVSFVMSKVKLDGDDKDTAATGIVRTYPFTAEINGAGGAALANSSTIITIQDSLAA